MSFADSSPIKIDLVDPLPKYGTTFRVSSIYLTSSDQPTTEYIVPKTSSDIEVSSSTGVVRNPAGLTSRSWFKQNFETKSLLFSWDLVDPRNDKTYSNDIEIQNNPYIDSFNVSLYQNSGPGYNGSTITGRQLLVEEKGIKNNIFNYEITGSSRHFSLDVAFVDVFGNSSSGTLVTENPPPLINITGSGEYRGIFHAFYEQDPNDSLSLVLYSFSGLPEISGYSGRFSQASSYVDTAQRITTGTDGHASIILTPNQPNYIMALSRDGYSTGSAMGVFKPVEYIEEDNLYQMHYVTTGATGEDGMAPEITGYFSGGFTGLSGGNREPLLFEHVPVINNLLADRLSGGDLLYYTFQSNYYTGEGGPNTTCYKVHGSGDITGAVSGYTGEILADYGVLFDSSYNRYNTGDQYIYDNSLSLQDGLYTGETVVWDEVTGFGFTGIHQEGSGAGPFWGNNSPAYVKTFSEASINYAPIPYLYTYFDPEEGKFHSATQGNYGVMGIYSMPKNDPNSYEIKYRSGEVFQRSYEQAATYLNAMGEMPAVILNNSQMEKMRNVSSQPGWVGLRSGPVGILSGLFSSYFVTKSFFDGFSFWRPTGEKTRQGYLIPETVRPPQSHEVSSLNVSGAIEYNWVEINDIGPLWAWTNGSGTEIYKYAGSGYNKIREGALTLQIKNDSGIVITGYSVSGGAPPPLITGVQINYPEDKSLNFQYQMSGDYYQPMAEDNYRTAWPNNYNVQKINLYTGNSIDFSISDDGLAKIFSGSGDMGIMGIQESFQYYAASGFSSSMSQDGDSSTVPPGFYKIIPFDTIGSGYMVNLNELIGDPKSLRFVTSDQLTQFSLNDARANGDTTVEVTFPFTHTSLPTVSHNTMYLGVQPNPAYLGAMLEGPPTTSGAKFTLSSAIPSDGYSLSIRSASEPI